jgi:hypothetical protein
MIKAVADLESLMPLTPDSPDKRIVDHARSAPGAGVRWNDAPCRQPGRLLQKRGAYLPIGDLT